ncbi:hypothetical protein ACFQ7A_13430 [Streptomyces sp. NPDC056528]|uniref:hypothetical protein n=1 Tax=Streptomyces sp. NPDC056528 TaxID=3345854 RepID=UPI00367BDCF4
MREFDGRYWDRHEPVRAVAAYRASLELNTRAGEARGAAIATYFLGCAQDAATTLRAERATHYEAQALVALADIAERTGLRRADVPGWLDRAAGIHEEGGSPLAPALRARLRAWGDE